MQGRPNCNAREGMSAAHQHRPGIPRWLAGGPYRFTRNPMYVGELGLWLGWSIYFGSIGLLIGFLLLCLILNGIVVPREERMLEATFQDEYLQYKARVPRWFGTLKN